MGILRTYILRVISAALICAIITAILGKKGTNGRIGAMLSSIFLAITMLSPVSGLDLSDWISWMNDFETQSESFTEEGEQMARNSMSEIIKQHTEAYILDKAVSYGAEVTADITIGEGELPVPVAVDIHGGISPAGKAAVSRIIEEELGIPKEEQRWIG